MKTNRRIPEISNKEIINRNLSLTFEFVKKLMDNPGLLEKLPDYFELNFLDKDSNYL